MKNDNIKYLLIIANALMLVTSVTFLIVEICTKNEIVSYVKDCSFALTVSLSFAMNVRVCVKNGDIDASSTNTNHGTATIIATKGHHSPVCATIKEGTANGR